MKKINLLFVPALFAILCTTAFFTGCKSTSSDEKDPSPIVGTWLNESLGDMNDDNVTTTLVIREDGTLTMTCKSDYDDIEHTQDMLWNVEGNTFAYAYASEDLDKDGVISEDEIFDEDNLEYDEVQFKIEGNTLTFSYEDRELWVFTKK